MALSRNRIERLFSAERFNAYVVGCNGDFESAVDLYRWNSSLTAAFWEPMGHLEVALRNTLAAQLEARNQTLGRRRSWLDDPGLELSGRARGDISAARARVRRKRKRVSNAQTISELSFGFWRFLIARRHTSLWPDLVGAFPNAPNRDRETIERPISRLHDFRNRLAHHQRIWNRAPTAMYSDLLLVAGYIDLELPLWIDGSSAVPGILSRGPRRRRVRLRRCEWSSVDARLTRIGARRMSLAEFDKHFGDLPTDGEG